MPDRYQALSRTRLGRRVVRRLGLPDPVPLERWRPGRPLVDGRVLTGGAGRLAGGPLPSALDRLGVAWTRDDDGSSRFKGLVVDATGVVDIAGLRILPELVAPRMRRLDPCPRLVVLGTPPELVSGSERVAQRALEGFTRSAGKEIGGGGTVQLVYVAPGAESALDSTLAFLLSPRSAYVSGQVVRVGVPGAALPDLSDPARPLAGRVAVVTGAARGIGAEIVRVLAREGAGVVGVDVAPLAGDLVDLATEVGGDHLVLDVTHPDAPQRLARHLAGSHGGVDVMVHNAGITRDRRLANLRADRWDPVLAVNLAAPERLTRELVDAGVLRPGGRVVGVSSVSGLAGNPGQSNYATSKAGVAGLVDVLAVELAGRGDGSTANAVAPGFIETTMTAAVPFGTREVGRRLNAMAQGGQPVDVAEAVAWLAHPGSAGVNGAVVRVCGLMTLGA